MIISASRRTDIPACYTPWLLARLRAGWCDVANPMNPQQVARVALCPEAVDAIAFWTRDAAPLLPHLPELDDRGYRYYFTYTLTGYGAALEPHAPGVAQAVATMRRVADHVGPDRLLWRYDPILLTESMPPAWHIAQFARLAAQLAGATRRVKLSLYQPYRYAATRLRRLGGRLLEAPDIGGLCRALTEAAAAHGMTVESCAGALPGVRAGRCIDPLYLAGVLGVAVRPGKDPGQRPGCGCAPSKDIGAYDTCPHGCAYCYATHRDGEAERRQIAHDADAPMIHL
jgi:hypothetical protein